MFDFLQQIADFIGMIIDLAIQLVTGIFDLLRIIPTAIQSLTEGMNMLPSFMVAFASITITVSVIFILVGREAGGGQ